MDNKPTPAAIPMDKDRKMKMISKVSLTAVRNRIMDIAPTNPNALAKLFPITKITIAVIMVNMTMEMTKVGE